MVDLWKLLPIVLLALSCAAPSGSRDAQGPVQQRGEAAPAKRTKMVVGFPGDDEHDLAERDGQGAVDSPLRDRPGCG